MRDIGVVAALPDEAATLGTWPGSGRIRVSVSGIGAQRAMRSAECLLDAGVTALASWGVAGGLSEVLKPGDLVLAEQIGHGEGVEGTAPAWNRLLLQAWAKADVDVLAGRLWSDDRAVTSVDEKRQLSSRGYDIVDMEAAAVARVARTAGVPFVAVKCVCDPCFRAVPLVATRLLRPDGRVRPLVLAMILLRGPRMWQALRCMHEDFRAACTGLGRAAPFLAQVCPT